jgi:hypothetical protein
MNLWSYTQQIKYILNKYEADCPVRCQLSSGHALAIATIHVIRDLTQEVT